MQAEVLTVGYQGTKIETFVARLLASGVGALADVRLTPISRVPGFSKTKLRERLEAVGIKYFHFPELGNPKEIRAAAHSVDECLREYESYMTDRWPDALGRLIATAKEHRTAVLCMEAKPRECHRTMVAARCAAAIGARVVHL